MCCATWRWHLIDMNSLAGRNCPYMESLLGGCERVLLYMRDHGTICLFGVSLFYIIFRVKIRGRELNTNLFSQTFRATPRDILAKSRDIPPKKHDFPGLEGHIELFGPTRSRERPLPHWKISGPKSLGWVPFPS